MSQRERVMLRVCLYSVGVLASTVQYFERSLSLLVTLAAE